MNIELYEIDINRTTRTITLHRMIHTFSTSKLMKALKQKHSEFIEIKELTQMFDINLKTAMKIAEKMDKYTLKFKESTGAFFESNKKYVLSIKDVKTYLLERCNVEFVERYFCAERDVPTWKKDYFFRKNMDQGNHGNIVFERLSPREDVEKIIDDVLEKRLRLTSRKFVQEHLTKRNLNLADTNAVDTYSTPTIDRLLKSVSILRITWEGGIKPTVKLVRPSELFEEYQEIIYQSSKRKTVKEDVFSFVKGMKLEEDALPFIPLEDAAHLGLKNTKGQLVSLNDVTAYEEEYLTDTIKIYRPLVDIRNTNERARYVVMGDLYELPKVK